MSVLVLGGAGYIGSHTVYELIEQGEDVIVIDNLETGHKDAIHPKARFYKGDIRNLEFLDNVFSKEKIDIIIHFAANSLVGESMKNPLKYYDNNLLGTKVLLEQMVKHKINKIVFSSTAATYGNPENIPILEKDKTMPTNPYGETKLAMEKMFYWIDRAHGIKYVSLRYFNACGDHKNGLIGERHNPETHLIPNILQVALGTKECVNIFGTDYKTEDGTCVRDYIHVTDLAKAHILAMKYLQGNNKSDIFNLGNGRGFSVKEIVQAARNITGKEIKSQIAERREGDPDILVASNEKARRVLGWEPEYTNIEEIIDSAWKYYINNE